MNILKFTKNMIIKYKQFIMFCMVGVINTLVTYIIYMFLFKLGVNYEIANAIGDIAGGINSYIWNRFWVFKDSNTKTIESAPKFVITFLIYMFASWILMRLCVQTIGIKEEWAKLVVLPITTVLNYVMNKIWTFSKKKK